MCLIRREVRFDGLGDGSVLAGDHFSIMADTHYIIEIRDFIDWTVTKITFYRYAVRRGLMPITTIS